MSRFITPPDKDFRAVPKIAIIDFSATDVELVALTAKVSAIDFDVYLYKTDYDNPQWLTEVSESVDQTFNSSNSSVNDVITYLQSLV